MSSSEKMKSQGFWHFVFTVGFLLVFILALYALRAQGKLHWPVPTFDFTVMILATYRLIRLFTYDDVTDYIRDYFSHFTEGPGKTLWHLLDCPWCSGMWLSMVVFILYFSWPIFWYLLLVLAMAGVASFIQITIWKIGLEK